MFTTFSNVTKILFYGFMFISVFIGCAKVGPDYEKPDFEVNGKWQHPDDPALVPEKTEITEWWTVFDDKMLTQYINDAADANLDLRIAMARVNEAKARLGVVTGGYYPIVGTYGDIMNGQQGKNLGGDGVNHTRFNAGFDASWEIDLFGKISRSVESAAADFQSTEEDRNDVMISLYAEIANTYINIRTLQAKLVAANNNIVSQVKTLKLTQSRFKYGLTSELDVSQAEMVLANSESQIPPLKIELNKNINTMALLLGKQPGALSDELSMIKSIPIPPEKVATGIPADILRQRPDIRSAERLLAAQTAKIGVAKADLYPTFSITGDIGLQSLDAGDFFSADSFFFSVGPSFRWNFFQGGRVREQIKVEDARTEQLILSYERTILNALNEVENAFTAFIQQRNQYDYLVRSVTAAKKSLRLATQLYKDGLTNFQSVLDSQRELFSAENSMVDAQGKAGTNLARLYKALGGGWDPETYKSELAKGSSDNSTTTMK